jgi:hypothetical protein
MSNANADNNPELKQTTRHSTMDHDRIEEDLKKKGARPTQNKPK